MVAAVEVIDGIANEAPDTRLLRQVAKHDRVVRVSADGQFCNVNCLTATDEIGEALQPLPAGVRPGSRRDLGQNVPSLSPRPCRVPEALPQAKHRLVHVSRSKTCSACGSVEDGHRHEERGLSKISCYNIRCVIITMYEFGIEADFW